MKPCLFQMERSILNPRLIAPFPAGLSAPARAARLVTCPSHRLPECTVGLIRSHRAESIVFQQFLPSDCGDSRTLSIYRSLGNTEWSQGREEWEWRCGLADAELLEVGGCLIFLPIKTERKRIVCDRREDAISSVVCACGLIVSLAQHHSILWICHNLPNSLLLNIQVIWRLKTV